MSAVDAISLAAQRQSEIGDSKLHYLACRYIAHQRLAVEKKYFPKFDKITVVSNDDAVFLKRAVKRDIIVIPNGVDTVFFSPGRLDTKRNVVLFTGNLSAPMNEEACLYLLQYVFPLLHSRHPDIELVIAGRAPTENIISAMPSYVTLKADMLDLRDALSSAILYVSPIAYGTGIKNNVLQAMAMGIPVVATKLIADPIGIQHGETGFVAERGPDFVQAIEMALANRVLLDRIGRLGRLHIEQNYSWQQVASIYMDMFVEIMSDRLTGEGAPC